MKREDLIENYMAFAPILHKKIFKGLNLSGITKQQFSFLYQLSNCGNKPMSYYGNKMMISKPNLTVLADKLIEEGLVQRDTNSDDRRVIILKITEKGEEYLNEQVEKIKKMMIKRFEVFSDSEIQRLNDLIEETKILFSKLEDIE